MKKFLTILFIGLLNFTSNIFADDKILDSLKEGNKIIFIRHAIAPGNGDPENFNIKDCSTQRNLSESGIKQSKKIGLFFKNNKIKIDQVLSSEWCRCKDTAELAFKNFKTFKPLNSFYDPRFAHNEEMEQRKDLLSDSIKILNDREKKILYSRRLTDDPSTLEELSKKFKISRERIRQIENKAFEKLQKHMLNSAKSKNLLQAN